MTVVLLTADLTVVSQVEGAATRVGTVLRAVSSESAAVELCIAEQAELLIIDLNAPSLNIKTIVEQVKTSASAPPRIVAFGPHVHEERLAAAREAGCDEVVSRGRFLSQLDVLISGAAN
jgi:DNA-binding response OmpR family regulator